MRVLVASSGGAGHVTPMLPFAAACREAGHEVLLVGPPGLASVATQHGLPFAAGALPPVNQALAKMLRKPETKQLATKARARPGPLLLSVATLSITTALRNKYIEMLKGLRASQFGALYQRSIKRA